MITSPDPFMHLRRCLVALVATPSLIVGSWASATPPADEVAPEAPAAGDRVVLMLPLEVEGELSEQDRRDLVTQMQAGFEHTRIVLTDSAPPTCSDDACLRAFGREMNADYVISTQISAGDRDYQVQMRALSVHGERPATRAKIDCPVCGIAEVSDQLAAKARVMRDWVLADSEAIELRIEGSPSSAIVSVDQQQVGTLPFSGHLGAGEHEVTVSAPNYISKTVPLRALSGSSVELVIDLEPEPIGGPRVDRAWRLPVAGTAIGLGVAALVTGATFLALDGRPIGSRCNDPANLDADGDCEFIYTSLPAGVGLTVGGAVLAGVGVGLLVVELKQRRTGDTAARVQFGVGLDRASLRVDF
ncbi:PEGA domain protein [Enhygromyxa salina]|uniref:PEGA domain protein n=1 Tax=Enhygromyxa salina TaxID=215803 RepID=A0A2S9YJY3_9BACT|nr:PEGA domain-containing protein [Enhygromyxa salina]PRQ05380.1 PEGA domain protein [Enhygromyxa salina]